MPRAEGRRLVARDHDRQECEPPVLQRHGIHAAVPAIDRSDPGRPDAEQQVALAATDDLLGRDLQAEALLPRVPDLTARIASSGKRKLTAKASSVSSTACGTTGM